MGFKPICELTDRDTTQARLIQKLANVPWLASVLTTSTSCINLDIDGELAKSESIAC